jgi:hypothetical protein
MFLFVTSGFGSKLQQAQGPERVVGQSTTTNRTGGTEIQILFTVGTFSIITTAWLEQG